MIINSIEIENLRNHIQSVIEFSPQMNIICGPNGAGKTTILEAISYAGISKSFLPASDSLILNNNQNYFLITAKCTNDIGNNYRITIKYTKGQKKQINSSFGDNLLPKDIIGIIPVVILNPDFKPITSGSPQDRRQFIDSILCQTSKVYLKELMDFKRILKQRNNLLQQAKYQYDFDYSQLNPWNELFINSAAEIIFRRLQFIRDFQPIFNDSYKRISLDIEKADIEYLPNCLSNILSSKADKTEITKFLFSYSEKIRKEEYRRTTTLFGPQKDDFRIRINGGTARDIASQGQHKTLLIALKFAEYDFIYAKTKETPVFLLDDMFAELDINRRVAVLDNLQSLKTQTFITSTRINSILKSIIQSNGINEKSNMLAYNINNGFVEKIERL